MIGTFTEATLCDLLSSLIHLISRSSSTLQHQLPTWRPVSLLAMAGARTRRSPLSPQCDRQPDNVIARTCASFQTSEFHDALYDDFQLMNVGPSATDATNSKAQKHSLRRKEANTIRQRQTLSSAFLAVEASKWSSNAMAATGSRAVSTFLVPNSRTQTVP